MSTIRKLPNNKFRTEVRKKLTTIKSKTFPTANMINLISLLNSDYKILSYTLALRIKKILNLIINADQTGYIKNRFIGFNLRQIQDVIDYADKFNIEGAILFIDFSKAFDTLEWNFMYHTLEYFGFK